VQSVVQEAMQIVEKRGRDYGDPLPNFQRIAAFWSVVFGQPVTPQQVAQCMRLVKESRLIATPGHRDSLVDICGYADCENVVCTKLDIAAYRELESMESRHATGNANHGDGPEVVASVCSSACHGMEHGRLVRPTQQAGQADTDRAISER
jgi:hypothetical protein